MTLDKNWKKFLTENGMEVDSNTWLTVGSWSDAELNENLQGLPPLRKNMLRTAAIGYREPANQQRNLDLFFQAYEQLKGKADMSGEELEKLRFSLLKQHNLVPKEPSENNIPDGRKNEPPNPEKAKELEKTRKTVPPNGPIRPNDPARIVGAFPPPPGNTPLPVSNTVNRPGVAVDTIISKDGDLIIDPILSPEGELDPINYGPLSIVIENPVGGNPRQFDVVLQPNDSIRPHQAFDVKDATVPSGSAKDVPLAATITVVDVHSNTHTLTQQSDKTFVFPKLPDGKTTIRVTKPGYKDVQLTVLIWGDVIHSDRKKTVFLTPLNSKPIAKLEWGSEPRDLDLHCHRQTDGEVIFYSHKAPNNEGNGTYSMWLDRDDTNGNGCETITFDCSRGPHYFYVHHYAGSSNIAASSAKVTVETPKGTKVIKVKEALGSHFSGNNTDVWRVCKVLPDGTIIEANDKVQGTAGVKLSW